MTRPPLPAHAAAHEEVALGEPKAQHEQNWTPDQTYPPCKKHSSFFGPSPQKHHDESELCGDEQSDGNVHVQHVRMKSGLGTRVGATENALCVASKLQAARPSALTRVPSPDFIWT